QQQPAAAPADTPHPNARLGLDTIQSDLRWTISTDTREDWFSNFSLGGRMTPSRIMLLLVALIAGGTAAYLVTQRDTPEEPAIVEPVARIVEEARTQILVASRTIHVGERLTPDSLEWKAWPVASV